MRASGAVAAALAAIALVVLGAAAGTASPVAPGLVAAYSFDERTGSIVADASGNGNAGTVIDAAWTGDGRFGGALTFDGAGDSVGIADSASLDLGAGMTLEAWVKPTARTSWASVVVKARDSGGLVYGLRANASTPEVSADVFTGAVRTTRNVPQLPLDAWTHLAATYDGVVLRLYVNGALASSRSVSGSMPATSGSLRVGGNSDSTESFHGAIDEVRIYDRALSAAEIQADMNVPVVPPEKPPALFVSAAGSDASACTQPEPCASLDHAYDLAAPGDVVEIAAGTYPVQVVTGTKAAPPVLMRPAFGAQVVLAELGVRADQLELRDVAVPGGVAVRGESDFATLRNLDLGGRLYIAGPRDLTIIGGDVGPFVDGPSWITHEDGVPPQRVLIEGVHFHDFTVSGPGVHTECMLVVAGDGLVFRGNKWTNCAVYDLSFGFCCASPAPPTNVLIENNFFARPSGGSTTTLHFNSNLDPAQSYTIRSNSSDGSFVLDQNQATFSNVVAVGNALDGGGCDRVAWSYNVFRSFACAGVGNRLVADIGFVDAAAGDLHRTPDSPLADAGSPTDYPVTDIDGERRPLGAAPDAGADER